MVSIVPPEGGSGGAPVDAGYVVDTANPNLSAERVLTDGSNTTVNTSIPGQVKIDAGLPETPLSVAHGGTGLTTNPANQILGGNDAGSALEYITVAAADSGIVITQTGANLIIGNTASGAYKPGGTDVAIADGGTGQSTATAAFNALAPTQTGAAGLTKENCFLVSDGTGTATNWLGGLVGDTAYFNTSASLTWDDPSLLHFGEAGQTRRLPNLSIQDRTKYFIFMNDSSGSQTINSFDFDSGASQKIGDASTSSITVGPFEQVMLFPHTTSGNVKIWNVISWTKRSTASPYTASYLTLGTSNALDSERIATPGSGINFIDAGAGAALTIIATASGYISGSRNVSGTVSINSTDPSFIAISTASDATVTLPAASASLGRIFIFKAVQATIAAPVGASTSIVAAGADTINTPNTALTLTGIGEIHAIQCVSGTEWKTIWTSNRSYIWDASFTSTGNVTTGEDTLKSSTILKYSTNSGLYRFEAFGTYAASVATKDIKVKLGSTTLFDTGALAINSGNWRLEGTIARTGAGTGRSSVTFVTDNSLLVSSTKYTAISEDFTTDLTLLVTGEATNTDDVVCTGFSVNKENFSTG